MANYDNTEQNGCNGVAAQSMRLHRVHLHADRIIASGLLQDFINGFPDGFFQGLIADALQSLFNCEAPSDGTDAKKVVTRHHVGDGRYEPRFFARVARTIRQQARGRERLTRRQSHVVAKAILDHIRTAEAEDLSEVVFELRTR